MAVDGSATPLLKTWDANFSADGEKTYRLTYRVLVTSLDDGPAVVMTASGLPQDNDPYSVMNDSDPFAFVTSRVPKKLSPNGKAWEVTVTWKNSNTKDEDNKDDDGNPQQDPTLWRKKVELGFVSRTRPVEKALWISNSNKTSGAGGFLANFPNAKRAVVNSANQVLNPPPEMDDSRMIVRVTRWHRKIKPPWLQRFRDSINSIGFSIRAYDFPDAQGNKERLIDIRIPEFTAKMRDIQMQEEQRTVNDVNRIFYRLTFEILIDFKFGWRPEYVDRGTVQWGGRGAKDGHGGQLFADTTDPDPARAHQQRILDAQGKETVGPVLLDGKGEILSPFAAWPTVYMKWAVDDEVDFRELEL